MTKIATATTAIRLHAEGVLDLDAPIGTYLPDYRPHPTHGHPTTRAAAQPHRGARQPAPGSVGPARRPAAGPGRSRPRSSPSTAPPSRPVGARASYSNIGYLLAGEVIDSATGATDRGLRPRPRAGPARHGRRPATTTTRTLRARSGTCAPHALRSRSFAALLPSGIVGSPRRGTHRPAPLPGQRRRLRRARRHRRRRGPARRRPRRRHDGPPPRAQPPRPRGDAHHHRDREAVRPRHRLVPQARPTPNAPPRSSSTTAPAAASGTRCASTPTNDSPWSR